MGRIIITLLVELAVLLILDKNIYAKYGDKSMSESEHFWGRKGIRYGENYENSILDLIIEIYKFSAIPFIFWLFLVYMIKMNGNLGQEIQVNRGEILSFTICIIIGVSTMIGVVVSLDKNYYITFSLKDIITKLNIKRRITEIYILSLIIVVLYFNIPLFEQIENKVLSEFVNFIYLYCFVLVMMFSGIITYKLIIVIVSDAQFEYECLDNLHKKVWNMINTEEIFDDKMNCPGVVKDLSYLMKKYEKNIKI